MTVNNVKNEQFFFQKYIQNIFCEIQEGENFVIIFKFLNENTKNKHFN